MFRPPGGLTYTGTAPVTITGSTISIGTFTSVLESTVASGSVAIRIAEGARIALDGASTRYLYWDAAEAFFGFNGSVRPTQIQPTSDMVMLGSPPVIRTFGTTDGMTIRAQTTDAAGSYGVSIGSTTNLATQGAFSTRFVNNATTVVAAIGAIGGEYVVTTHGSSTAGDSSTSNTAVGSFIKDTTGTTYTLTNSLVSATSKIFTQFVSADATATRCTVAAGAGSAVFTFNAAPTADCTVNYWIVN